MGGVRGGLVRSSAWRRVVMILGIVLALLAALTATIAPNLATAEASAASFDYSMPKRYGMDSNGDGVIDSYVPTTTCTGDTASTCTNHPATSPFPVQPTTWHVDLNACANTGAVDFEWTVLANPAVTVQRAPGGGCSSFYAEFPAEGTYRVGLRVKTSVGADFGPMTWQDVVVQDFLIISMGDSYGAGEGSPDVPIDPNTFSDVEAAFAGLGDAIAQLANFGPCAPGTGFDFDACVTALDSAGNDAVADGADLIRQLNDPVCNIGLIGQDPGFDLFACFDLLANLAITGITQSIEAVGQAVTDAYNTYVQRFVDVYNAAAATVDSLNAVIDNFKQGAAWQDRRCHRSANAGASLAAQELENRDPHTSVTFIQLACTGAMILQGVLDTYAGAEDEVESKALPQIPPQVYQAAQMIRNREIDAVNFSIGGNDVNFGPMIFSCVLRVDCSQPNTLDDPAVAAQQAADATCPSTFPGLSTLLAITTSLCRDLFHSLAVDPLMGKSAAELFNLGVNGDPTDPLRPGIVTSYQMLSDALHRAPFAGPGTPDQPNEPGLGLPADRDNRVYITEYVNPLLRDDGGICNGEADGLNMIPGVSLAESSWLNSQIVPALTGVVRSGAQAEHWNFVTNIVSGFETEFGHGHGYCASDGQQLPTSFGDPADGRWMTRLQESFLQQGNKMGGVHPNHSGYRQYAKQILAAWMRDLYSDPSNLTGPRRPDQPPFADAGPDRVLDEGDSVTLTNNSYDGDGDQLTYAWSTGSPAFTVAPASSSAPTLTAVDDGAGTLRLSVDDGHEGSASDTAHITVRNVAPSVASTTATVDEGSTLTGNLGFTDRGTADTHTATIEYGDGSSVVPFAVVGHSVPLNHAYADEGSYSAVVTVTDDDGGIGQGTVAVTVRNVPPIVGVVAAPIVPVLIGTPVSVSAPFTDAGILDTHTAQVDWGDAVTTAATVTEGTGLGTVAATKSYASPGIYTVTVRVTDNDGGTGSNQFQYVVVYDPNGGFATGGGLIDSPAGAYPADPTVAGTAQFGFVSKYQKGANVPTGTTSFRFRAANFEFSSTQYDWLVVSGAKASYKGRGTVNGTGDYGFLLSAVDGNAQSVPGPDRLRLKMWDRATGVIVYDNQLGASDDATATTAIADGAITVGAAAKSK